MRQSRFGCEQMAAILREADLTSVAEAAKRNKASEQTINTWLKYFNRLQPSDVKRFKVLEAEKDWLKRLLTEHDIMGEVNRKKWWARRHVGNRLPWCARVACRSGAPAG